LVWFLPLLWLVASCASAPPRQTEFMASVEGVEMSSRELRLRLYSFTNDFGGGVERTADLIYLASDDPQIRRNSILWKLSAVPALHNQVFVEDPLVGCINAYAFCELMVQFFSPRGAGATVFGDQQWLAVAVSDTMQRRIYEVLLQVKPDIENAAFRAQVAEYVEQFPLQDLTFARQSTMATMAPLMSAVGPGGLDATGAMNEQMRVMNDRLAIYAESAPKQVRWQAELMLERFPDLADEQREAVIEAARAEALAAWEVVARMIEEMRAETMRDLGGERAAIMRGISEERQAALEALAGERQIVLTTLQTEREAILASVETIVRETLETLERSTATTTSAALERAYEHTRILLVLIFCGSLALLVVAWFLARNLIRTGRTGAGEH
jgi:hypothetical protein